MTNSTEMTDLKKIQQAIPSTFIEKLRVSIEVANKAYSKQDVNSASFESMTELIGADCRMILEKIRFRTWQRYGGSGMVMANGVFKALS